MTPAKPHVAPTMSAMRALRARRPFAFRASATRIGNPELVSIPAKKISTHAALYCARNRYAIRTGMPRTSPPRMNGSGLRLRVSTPSESEPAAEPAPNSMAFSPPNESSCPRLTSQVGSRFWSVAVPVFSTKPITISAEKLHGDSAAELSGFFSAFAGAVWSTASLTFVNRRARMTSTVGISRK